MPNTVTKEMIPKRMQVFVMGSITPFPSFCDIFQAHFQLTSVSLSSTGDPVTTRAQSFSRSSSSFSYPILTFPSNRVRSPSIIEALQMPQKVPAPLLSRQVAPLDSPGHGE